MVVCLRHTSRYTVGQLAYRNFHVVMADIFAAIWLHVFAFCLCVEFAQCGVFDYLPSFDANVDDRDTSITKYFQCGFLYKEILAFLAIYNGTILSLRQLKRILSRLHLRRRRHHSSAEEVLNTISTELSGSGSSLGYRLMHQRLRVDHGIVVDKESVRHILKALDPEGVELRSRRSLRRRNYYSKGPDYLWHLDGYDKLKPFGFCIHGAIDGYSRRILWLEVGVSNNDPYYVANYFVECIKHLGGVPRCIRADRGTENTNIASIQVLLRRDDTDTLAAEKSFVYGRSVSNQRIEAWWSFLKRNATHWWINLFKDMRDSGVYDEGDFIHTECLQFCFMSLIREELYKVAKHWNVHRIRPTKNTETHSGRPDVLYFLPEANDTQSYMHPVPQEDIEVVGNEFSTVPPERGGSEEFQQLANLIMDEHDLQMPTTVEEAKLLHMILTSYIRNL